MIKNITSGLILLFSSIALFSRVAVSEPIIAEKVIYQGTSEGMAYQVSLVAENLGVPWGMAFIDSDHLLITERQGFIKTLNRLTGAISHVQGGPKVLSQGQGGLLDVAMPEGSNSTGWIYFTYSKRMDDGGVTTLARAHLAGSVLKDWEDLLVTRSATNASRHYGSRIAFDGKGHLFFTVGDRGHRPNGQDLTTHAGSVVRVNLDGSIPKDNPFLKKSNGLPGHWSFGHRNPQGIAFDAKTQKLWAIEHGPRGGDEINHIHPGLNYGWPTVSFGKEYWGPFQVGEGTEKAGMEPPVKVYIPSIAPGSLLLYRGQAFPQWQGNLFAGALKLAHINRVELNKSGRAQKEERLLEHMGERIRALVESPEGWIYFSTDSGKIFKISEPNGSE